MFTGYIIVKEVSLEQAADLLGKPASYLRKLCNSKPGVPGAKLVPWGKREKWVLNTNALDYLRGKTIIPSYDLLIQEWIEGLRSGKLTKNRNPAAETTIHNYTEIGMPYFWQYSEAQKSIQEINYKNLDKALLAVPIDRERENCGFAKKDMMFRAIKSIYKLLVLKGIRPKEERESLTELKPTRLYRPKVKRIRKNHFDKIMAANTCKGTGSKLDKFHIEVNKTIIYLMGLGGLRKHEIPLLTLSDVDFENQELSVIGKGGKREIIGVPCELIEQLKIWIKGERVKRIKIEHGCLVVQADGSPITSSAISSRIQRLEKKAKVPFSPHSFRHFCATLQADSGTPQHVIQALLRHADPSTTHGYIHTEKQFARDFVKKKVF